MSKPADYPIEFRNVRRVDSPRANVIWITHAGGGTAALVRLAKPLDATEFPVNIDSPIMPRREERHGDGFDGDLDRFAELLAADLLAAELPRNDHSRPPLILIGHSFGAVLAYRVAHHLIAGGVTPHRLVAMSFAAPGQRYRGELLAKKTDDDLIETVDRVFGGVPKEIRDDATARAVFAPPLRNDLAMIEQYRHHADTPPLPLNITAIGGVDDRAVDVSMLRGWSDHAAAGFRLRLMPGDHFFPLRRFDEVLRVALWDVVEPSS